MKRAVAILAVLAMTGLFGCEVSSPRGGGMSHSEGFNVVVPRASMQLEQGAIQTVTVSLMRGEDFKQDVKLQLKATPGLTVEPANLTIKASADPDAQIRISAAKDAPLGDHRVTITGTPTTGESTMAEIRVKVVAP